MKAPYFSIVIPLFNKENFIAKAIESVLMQTVSDFEIIIVDDCSTDRSVEIAKRFGDNRIRIVYHDINKGLSAARNTGIRHSTSGLIVFLDADDQWTPNFLGKIKALVERFPKAGLFATAYAEVYPKNKILAPSVNKHDIADGEMVLIDDFFAKNLQQPIYNHSSVCIRREIFEEGGFYDEAINFSEDVDFNIRANAIAPLAYCNSVESFYYVMTENQITGHGIKGKSIPMLDGFQTLELHRPDVKKYIDFERYVLAMHCKMSGRWADFTHFTSSIAMENLTAKQRLMLRLPIFVLRPVKKIKAFLLLKGIRLTTY